MQQDISPRTGTAQLATACQLFLSHLVASGVGLGTFYWLTHMGVPSIQSIPIALAAGAIIGLLLTLNVLYNLQLLELILARFAQALPIEMVGTFWRWPFTSLFMQVYRLSERINIYQQQAQMTTEFREQSLRQASEAAALAERNRIARDLHDSIKQQIFSISVSAAAAKAHMNGTGEDALEAVEDIQNSVKEAQVEMRALLQQLRSSPLENTNLREALETQAQALGYRTGTQVHIEIAELPTTDQLPPGAQEAIFRMVQEAFANIARHARAETIWLELYQQEKQLHIEIRDDGQGFDLQTVQRGMGLNNLQERAEAMRGRLNIQSSVGKGTSISTVIPLLDALPTPEEQEHRQLEIRRMVEQGNGHFQLATSAVTITVVLSALNTPDLVLLLALGVIIYGYVQGLYAKIRVAILTGKESIESRSLQRREHGARLLLFLFLLFCIYFINFRLTLWRYSLAPWLLLVATLLIAGLMLFGLWQRYHAIQHYYDVLQQPLLNWELELDRKRSLRRIRIWLIIAAFEVIFGHLFLIKSLSTPIGQISVITATLVLTWGIVPCIDYQQISRWKQRLALAQIKKKLKNV